MSDSESQRSASRSPELTEKKKRKRNAVAPEDELEIDVNAPEPASKKAKRKEKKQKSSKPAKTEDEEEEKPDVSAATTAQAPAPGQRSEYGIWIGNLPWSATKDTLRTWFFDQGIDDRSITRLHMPAPPEEKGPSRPGFKPLNKGFAYVDFLGEPELQLAMALSEKLMGGRKVLIKNAKSFEGRPTQTAAEQAKKVAATPDGKEPTQRIFVGNLGFDVTKDDLMEHFAQAGGIEDIHMATFQDTGKCKGFAWVRFYEVESAAAAVRGYIFKSGADSDEEDEEEEEEGEGEGEGEDEGKKKSGKNKKRKEKKRKWFINRLAGRPLRCEFAEDAQTRYKKRYGKPAGDGGKPDGRHAPRQREDRGEDYNAGEAVPDRRAPRKMDADQRQAMRRQRHIDARNVAPGKALATAQRASTAIVAPTGKKTTFD